MTACPSCGAVDFKTLFTSTDRLYHTTREEFRIVSCTKCGLMRLHPQPSPEELPRYYPSQYWHDGGADAAGRLEEIYRRIVLRDHVRFVERAVRESQEQGPLLDVGCGGGLLLRMLAERGLAVMGLDFSAEAASIAWKRNLAPVVCGTLTNAPFAAGSFAAVTLFHVLEHLHEPRKYIEAAGDLLRPGGRLIVQVPNAACWQFVLLGEAWNGTDAPRHLVHFRAADLEALLVSCGFEVLRRKHFSLRDNPAGLATSLAPRLDPMARRVRRVAESSRMRVAKDLIYLGLVVASLPFTVLEAACRAGSTIMLEARKKA